MEIEIKLSEERVRRAFENAADNILKSEYGNPIREAMEKSIKEKEGEIKKVVDEIISAAISDPSFKERIANAVINRDMSTEEFTIETFDGSGQYVVLNREEHYKDTSYLSKLTYKVCYGYGNGPQIHLVAMTDGLVEHSFVGKKLEEAKQLLCDYLNQNGFRRLKHEELIRIAVHQQLRCKK